VTRRRRAGTSDDDGFATLAVLALATVLCLLGAVLAATAAVAVARHRAASVADLAALAAAARAVHGAPAACAAAGAVATAAGGRLTACDVYGSEAQVVAEVRPPEPVGRFGTATARARAGPAVGQKRGR
jgi:secretion/DNA translocation related TadE-like protein